MKRLIAIMCAVAMLAGCSATQRNFAFESGKIMAEANQISAYYADIESVIRKEQAVNQTYSEDEWRELLNIDAIFDMAISRVQALSALDISGINVFDVDYVWRLVKDGYNRGYPIVAKNIEAYPASTQAQLRVFNQQAIDLNTRIDTLLNEPSSENITEALSLIVGVLGLAAKVLAVSAATI